MCDKSSNDSDYTYESSESYVKTKSNFHDRLQSKEAMLKKLENYERVDDIEDVPMNTHIRYVTLDKNKKQVFRVGGLLKYVEERYIMLNNGSFSWSVQRYHYADEESDEPIFETIFWKCMTPVIKLQSRVAELEENVEILEEQLKTTREENEKLKAYIRLKLKK